MVFQEAVYNLLRLKTFMVPSIYRGSYMSAHDLLKFLNEVGKRDKMQGLPSILSLFRNKL